MYYQPFFDKKDLQKHTIQEKRYVFYNNMKERFNVKDDILFLKKLIEKIKRNEVLINSINKKDNKIGPRRWNEKKNERVKVSFFVNKERKRNKKKRKE